MVAKVGSFAQQTSTGDQAITGVGFIPKIVLFYAGATVGDGELTNANMFVGIAIAGNAASTSNKMISACSNRNVSTSQVLAGMVSAETLHFNNFAGSTFVGGDFKSFDSDGFTINWNTVDASSRIINYIAIGGADIANLAVGEDTMKTTSGTKATTGLGFQPYFLHILTSALRTTSPAATGSPESSHYGLGWGNSASARGYSGFYLENGASSAKTKRAQKNNQILGHVDNAVLLDEADLSSLDSDGFTLNYGTVSGSARYFYYLAMRGGNYQVGTFSQPGTTGNSAVTGVGFQPTVLILQSFNNASSSSVLASARYSFGAGTSSTQRFALWMGHTDGSNPTAARQDSDRTKIIKLWDEGLAGSTLKAAADLVSLDSDGFTLNWTTADATAREIQYIAIYAPNPDAAVTAKRLRSLLGVGS